MPLVILRLLKALSQADRVNQEGQAVWVLQIPATWIHQANAFTPYSHKEMLRCKSHLYFYTLSVRMPSCKISQCYYNAQKNHKKQKTKKTKKTLQNQTGSVLTSNNTTQKMPVIWKCTFVFSFLQPSWNSYHIIWKLQKEWRVLFFFLSFFFLFPQMWGSLQMYPVLLQVIFQSEP